MGQRLLIPIVQSVQDDLKQIREHRKAHEKARERYEGLAIRYSSLPKQKEYSLVREDTFQLYEGRRTYFTQLLAYIVRMSKFKTGADMFFVEKCLGTIGELKEFTHALNAMVEAMGMPAAAMRTQLSIWQMEAKSMAARMDRNTNEALEIVRVRHSPDAPYEVTKGVEKEGYLFKRRQKGIVVSWRRVYVTIKDGLFIQWTMGPRRGTIERSFGINVLLCELRPADVDRKYCFEVHTAHKTFCYQAESEEDLRDWIRVFENAKNHALQVGSSSTLIDTGEGVGGGLYSAGTETGTPTVYDSLDETGSITDQNQINSQATNTANGIRIEVGMNNNNNNAREAFMPVPTSETTFSSFSCLWTGTGGTEGQTNRNNFGHVYGTERSLIFASNLFGVNQSTSINWVDICEQTYSMSDVTGMLTIKATGNMVIHAITFFNEQNNYEMLMFLWRNARSEKPKTVAELRVSISQPLSGSTEPAITTTSINAEAVSCGCGDHLERTEIDVVLPLNVDKLFDLLMEPDSPFLSAFNNQRDYRNFTQTSWTLGAEGKDERTAHFIVPVNHPLTKLKETDCTEIQTMVRRDPGQCYVIRKVASTPAVTYGDAFSPVSLFCLTHQSTGHSRLRVHVGVIWHKSPLVKSMIRSTTLKAMTEIMTTYRQVLWAEIRKTNPGATEKGQSSETNPDSASSGAIISTTTTTNDTIGSSTFWWSEYWELLRDLYLDLTSRWKANLDICNVSWASLCFFLGSLLTLTISILLVTLYRPFLSPLSNDHSNFSIPLDYHPPQSLPLGTMQGPWNLPINKNLFHTLAKSHNHFRLLRQDLRIILNNLDSAECRIFHAQYVTWLADRLSACYADLQKSINLCKDLDTAWSTAIDRPSPCAIS